MKERRFFKKGEKIRFTLRKRSHKNGRYWYGSVDLEGEVEEDGFANQGGAIKIKPGARVFESLNVRPK